MEREIQSRLLDDVVARINAKIIAGEIDSSCASDFVDSALDDAIGNLYGGIAGAPLKVARKIDQRVAASRIRERHIQDLIESRWCSIFRRYEKCIAQAERINQSMEESYISWIRDDPGSFEDCRRRHLICLQMINLQARGRLIASEVLALVRAGFEGGASARTRTLQEIVTVAGIIAQDRTGELADRFNDSGVFEWLKSWRAHKGCCDLQETDEDYIEARETERRVIGRWGKEIREQNGWARPAFQGQVRLGQPIRFTDMERLAGTHGLRAQYLDGNHEIHSGPLSVINHADLENGTLSFNRRREGEKSVERVGGILGHSARLLDLLSHISCRALVGTTQGFDEMYEVGQLSHIVNLLFRRIASMR